MNYKPIPGCKICMAMIPDQVSQYQEFHLCKTCREFRNGINFKIFKLVKDCKDLDEVNKVINDLMEKEKIDMNDPDVIQYNKYVLESRAKFWVKHPEARNI